MVQWLRLFTPNSGTWFQSLARETAAKNPTSHNKDQRFQVLQLNLSEANQINIKKKKEVIFQNEDREETGKMSLSLVIYLNMKALLNTALFNKF